MLLRVMQADLGQILVDALGAGCPQRRTFSRHILQAEQPFEERWSIVGIYQLFIDLSKRVGPIIGAHDNSLDFGHFRLQSGAAGTSVVG